MALQTETFDACMSQVQEEHRGATETCPSLSSLPGAQPLVQIPAWACLLLMKLKRRSRKGLAAAPRWRKTAVLWIILSVVPHQQQDPKGKQSPPQSSTVKLGTSPSCNPLRTKCSFQGWSLVLSTPVFTDKGNIHFTAVLTVSIFWYPCSSPHHPS